MGFFYFWIETKRNGQYLKNMGTSPNSVNRRKLFQIHWYYSMGKGNHTFRKRVTRFYSVQRETPVNHRFYESCNP